MAASKTQQQFSNPLLNWFDKHGRKDLPWQHPRSPYRVWISEIMLQQTQVKTVIPYFNRFLDHFPTVDTLASAFEDDVLALWSGLGYYSRARNLHKTAKIIQADFQGHFPSELEQLIALPGIGPSTGAAIASLAFNKPTAILDGNVKRVLSRYFLIDGIPTQAAVHKTLWKLAAKCMPSTRAADYTQAIMDLGATCCTAKNPSCTMCPLQTSCRAQIKNEVSNYPNKAVKKKLPIKQQQFLLLYTTDHSIYLEKRPSTGLWGGLWCLPSIEINDCPEAYISTTYGLHTNRIKPLMALNHSFSHFHLKINAISMRVNLLTNSLDDTGCWFSPNQLVKVGLAKPVSSILNYFLTYIDNDLNQ